VPDALAATDSDDREESSRAEVGLLQTGGTVLSLADVEALRFLVSALIDAARRTDRVAVASLPIEAITIVQHLFSTHAVHRGAVRLAFDPFGRLRAIGVPWFRCDAGERKTDGS
jgi:hypothetical protein